MVLSYGLWQRRFGASENVIGSNVTLSGKSTTVVGVMPAGFDYPAQSELWVPFPIDAVAERRDNRFLSVVGRLKTGGATDLNSALKSYAVRGARPGTLLAPVEPADRTPLRPRDESRFVHRCHRAAASPRRLPAPMSTR